MKIVSFENVKLSSLELSGTKDEAKMLEQFLAKCK
jgi:hypothetical protein